MLINNFVSDNLFPHKIYAKFDKGNWYALHLKLPPFLFSFSPQEGEGVGVFFLIGKGEGMLETESGV